MTEYFHATNTRGLQPGHVFVAEHTDYQDPFVDALIKRAFSGGVTGQGRYVMYAREEKDHDPCREIELAFELVRRMGFPDAPSRWACVYACESIEGARAFTGDFGWGEREIWRVASEHVVKVDAGWLMFHPRVMRMFNWAARYWSGEANPFKPPRWEVLLQPPVTLIERVEGDLSAAPPPAR